MEQELFSTIAIAADLEHKSKNPRRDVLDIAERLGFSPVATRNRTHNGKNTGGRPEKLWSKEQRDAILAYNRNRHMKPAQVDSPDEKHQPVDDNSEPITDAAPVTDITLVVDSPVVAEPAPVVKEITLAQRADRIRQLQADVQHGIIQIGFELIAAKEQVGHGNWTAWLETEFEWTDRTARNFMAIAERFGNTKRKSISVLSTTTLIKMLALPEGDEEKFIDAQAAAGTPVEKQSARDVQKNVKQWKQRQAPKKNSGNTALVDELQPIREDVPAEDFTVKLASFDAQIAQAKADRDAAKAAYDRAVAVTENAIAARQDFLGKVARDLTSKLHKTCNELHEIKTTTIGGAPYIINDFSNVYIAITPMSKFAFDDNDFRRLALYDTPAHVEAVITRIKDAIAADATEFVFPTVDELTTTLD